MDKKHRAREHLADPCYGGVALVSIAHPDFREDLERQAYEHRLILRGLSS